MNSLNIYIISACSVIAFGCSTLSKPSPVGDVRTPAASCQILNDSAASNEFKAGIMKRSVTQQLYFETEANLMECNLDVAAMGNRACQAMSEERSNQKIVELIFLNAHPDWSSSKIVLAGECRETDSTEFVGGTYRKRLKFYKTSGLTLLKALQ